MTDIEVICVDGGSTDGTLEIIEEYTKKDDRFFLVTDTRGSYGAQVNRGVELAKGSYIAIAEPDDYVSKKMYEVLYTEAAKTRSDIVKGDYCRFIGDGEERRFFPKSACREDWYGIDLNATKEKDLLENTPANWSGIYRREFLNKERIKHNTTKGAAYQDLGFWFLTTILAKKIRFVRMTGYHYRIDNPNSSINSTDKENCLNEELAWIEAQLKTRDLFEEYSEKYFRIRHIHTEWMKRKMEGSKDTESFRKIVASKDSTCILFGCGADGVEYLTILMHEGLLTKVRCLTDNDSTLWGKQLLGISVVSPEEATEIYSTDRNKETIFVISSSRYREQIQEQLERYGVNRDRIFQTDI